MVEWNGSTAYDWLVKHATNMPDSRAFAQWSDGAVGSAYSFRQLRDLVDEVTSALHRLGARAGDRLVLSLPNGVEFVALLLACVRAGVIAVPAPVPSIGRFTSYRERIVGIVLDSQPRFAVATDAEVPRLTEILTGLPTRCQVLTWPEIIASTGGSGGIDQADCPIALLQYTSGSTTAPRGVLVTHEAVGACCAQATRIYRETTDDLAVTWVPLHHDMGLVTGVMRPLFSGYPSVLLASQDFLAAPATWLDALHTCRGTVSSAPNSGYEMCVRKIADPEDRGWDLSHWRVARNAAEVVRADTLDRFARHFAAARFDPASMAPSYGLAEATLVVTSCGPDNPPLRLWVSRQDLAHDPSVQPDAAAGTVQATSVSDSEAVQLVSSGTPAPGTSVQIMAANGPMGVGRIEVSGPQVSPGYWTGAVANRAELAKLAQRWLPTGDIGFVREGHLFVLGRSDDVFILRGRNFFGIDIAAVCATVPGARPGRAAAFLLDGGFADTPTVCVVTEVARDCDRSAAALTAVSRGIKSALARTLELGVGVIGLLPAGELPVTTSGKVRLAEVRRRYLAKEFAFLNVIRARDGARLAWKDR
jgi:acyl-CoA synthetase (AMP-forming)/AMP-acid ligase II